jgi:DNA-binding NarL/FixJ family response regulator
VLHETQIEPPPLTHLSGKVRVLVADNHPLMREGVAAILGGKADLTLVGEAGDGREAIEKFRDLQPDVTVMDLGMPRMSGIDAMRVIRLETPSARIVALTAGRGDALAQRALKAGAYAYVLKERVRAELADIIRAVHQGNKCIEPSVALEIADHLNDPTLTPREIEVLQLVAAGNSNKRIARALRISAETANTHMKNLIAKLRARDRTHAVTLSLRRGIIQLDESPNRRPAPDEPRSARAKPS